jgi:hypothetical protein
MDMNDTLVFDELIVVIDRDAFGVDAQDGVAQPAEFISTIGKRDLRNQQNDEDPENYELLFN